MTTAVAFRRGIAVLSGAPAVRNESPKLDAEVLLRHVLKLDRAAFYGRLDRELTAGEVAHYEALLRRRAAGEPVAYLVGRREFMGLSFVVDRRVLIPRPETETLVERALALLGGRQARRDKGRRTKDEGVSSFVLRAPSCGAPAPLPLVADVGTGSGAIAVAIAHAAPGCRIVATDLSADALAVARINVQRLLGAAPRVHLVRARLLEAIGRPIDLICANLPYIPTGELATLPIPVRDFEPWAALDGGPDGLQPYRDLLADAPAHLRPGGALLMECGPGQTVALCELALDAFPGASVTIHRDLAGQERVVEVLT